jgi:ABC-type branched-subunit amino acid transport system ATPase component
MAIAPNAPIDVDSVPAGEAASLEVDELEVSYGKVVALRPLTFHVDAGTVLAVIGPNGAGKTSLANALIGIIPSHSKSLKFGGREITKLSTYQRARLGMGHVPDSRAIFPSLTVAENLRMGFHLSGSKAKEQIEQAYEAFPSLAKRKRVAARKLSGGEQQMLSLARLLIAPPRLLIVDELSHGLAPGIVAMLFQTLEGLKGRCSMIIIEQFVSRAVDVADWVVVLSHGELRHSGPAATFTPERAAELYSLHEGQGSEQDPPAPEG